MSAVDLLDIASGAAAFDDAYQIAEKARALFESARDAYRSHIQKHGCQARPISLAERAP